MNARLWLIRATTLAVLATLTACGGSGGASEPPVIDPPPPPPPTGGGATPKGIEGGGIISSFGADFKSVTVGSTTYDTSASDLMVLIDDQPVMLSQLRVGNVVRVKATTEDEGQTQSATSIEQVNDLEGPITAGSINLATGTFEVLGQQIRVVATTLFDDNIVPDSLAGLADGDEVEVSVLLDGNGAYVATRIDRDDDAGDFELTGEVSMLDEANLTFAIGALTVDYSNATLDDFDGAALANGLLVEVEGDTLDANGALVAVSVENLDTDFEGDEGDFVVLDGFVTRFASVEDFDVDGFTVLTNSSTQFVDGVAADLAVGVNVEVDGELNADGVLVAAIVDFDDEDDLAEIEFRAPVDAVDASASTITVLGTLISVTASTSLEDNSDQEVAAFTLDDLSPGDFVEVRLFQDDEGFIAVRLEREDADDEVDVYGPAAQIQAPTLTVAGISVATTPDTDFDTGLDFFDTVMDGDLIEVSGSWDGVTLTAREIGFDEQF